MRFRNFFVSPAVVEQKNRLDTVSKTAHSLCLVVAE